MGALEKIIVVASFVLVPLIGYYFLKKTDRWNYSWMDISWIILFTYLWSFFNIFVHECGHALTSYSFGYAVEEVSVGIGLKLFSFGGGKSTKLIFRILPIYGSTSHPIFFRTNNIRIVVLAMGVITQFLFLGLIYWLLKKNKKWQGTLFGHFCYHYAIKIAFWLTSMLNFPFVLANSDWTKITKILFGWKWK